jgi:hypothetical protein
VGGFMSIDDKVELLIKEVRELKAIFIHGNFLNKKPKKAKEPKTETSEEIANRLFAKIVTVEDARKAD